MQTTQTDAFIIGSGPAGCSAALYLCRAGLGVTVAGKGGGSLERAEKIENYYGLGQPLRGGELTAIGKQQCAALGARLLEDEATVKTFYKENGHFRLQPENDTMDPIFCDEVIILGKVVSLLRYY